MVPVLAIDEDGGMIDAALDDMKRDVGQDQTGTALRGRGGMMEGSPISVRIGSWEYRERAARRAGKA